MVGIKTGFHTNLSTAGAGGEGGEGGKISRWKTRGDTREAELGIVKEQGGAGEGQQQCAGSEIGKGKGKLNAANFSQPSRLL